MGLNQLRYFLAAYDLGSFAAAGRALGCTSQCVAQAVTRVEDAVAATLFERVQGRPLRPTAYGRALRRHVHSILDIWDIHIPQTLAVAENAAGELEIGFDVPLTGGPFRIALEQFRKISPNVEIVFREDTPNNLAIALREGQIDVAVAGLMTDIDGAEITARALWNERLIVAMPEDHPLAKVDRIDWPTLLTHRIMLRRWEGSARIYELIARNFGGDRLMPCGQHIVSRTSLAEIAQLGFGVAVLFASAKVAHPGLIYRDIEEDNARVTIKAAWRSTNANAALGRFFAILRDHLRDEDRLIEPEAASPSPDPS